MRNRDAVLSVAVALLLAGCANRLNVNSAVLPTFDAHDGHAASEFSAGGERTLYLGIVDGLIKQNRQGAALAFLDGYRQDDEPLPPRYWLLRGNALFGLHRDSEAIDAFSELHGTSLAPYGWSGLGRIAAEKGDWSVADQDFHKAVDGDPANADFLNNLAFAELHLDKADAATAWLQQAHELEPGSDRILTNLVIALTLKGDGAGADIIIAGIKDGGHREAVRAVVKSAVAALNMKGKS